MSSHADRADTGRHQQEPPDTPRLRVKAEHTGYVDGAWWPRSDDLSSELPGLLAALAGQMGPASLVTFHPAEWIAAPEDMHTGGKSVRLEGTDLQRAGTVAVTGSDAEKMQLVVIPHHFDPDTAQKRWAGHN